MRAAAGGGREPTLLAVATGVVVTTEFTVVGLMPLPAFGVAGLASNQVSATEIGTGVSM